VSARRAAGLALLVLLLAGCGTKGDLVLPDPAAPPAAPAEPAEPARQ
jgi:predicted small lipoprotein YifL